MATFLDATLLSNFSIIFTFILVYVIVYGTLEFGKPFGLIGGNEKSARGLHALIALTMSFFVSFYEPVILLIGFAVPWFFMLGLFAFLILFVLKMFTGDKVDFSRAVSGRETTLWWVVVVIAIVILIFGLGQVFGQQSLEAGGGGTPVANSNQASVSTGDGSADDFIRQTGVGNSGVTGREVATADFSTNVLNTLVNPKVLGMILVLLMGVFAFLFISD